MEKIYKRIPNLLKKYRRIRGLKQRQVAKLLGLRNASRISRWEKGKCLPNIVNLFRLSILYRTLPDGLFIDLVRALREEIRTSEAAFFGVKEKQLRD